MLLPLSCLTDESKRLNLVERLDLRVWFREARCIEACCLVDMPLPSRGWVMASVCEYLGAMDYLKLKKRV